MLPAKNATASWSGHVEGCARSLSFMSKSSKRRLGRFPVRSEEQPPLVPFESRCWPFLNFWFAAFENYSWHDIVRDRTDPSTGNSERRILFRTPRQGVLNTHRPLAPLSVLCSPSAKGTHDVFESLFQRPVSEVPQADYACRYRTTSNAPRSCGPKLLLRGLWPNKN
jgi:hypothetical protein